MNLRSMISSTYQHMTNIWSTDHQHMINTSWRSRDPLARSKMSSLAILSAAAKSSTLLRSWLRLRIERFHRHMLCLLNNHLPQVLLQWQQIFPQIGHNHSHASGFFGFLSDLNSCRDRPSDNGGDERCDRGLEAKDCGHCCRNWSAHTFKVWKERLGWSVEIIGWCSSY